MLHNSNGSIVQTRRSERRLQGAHCLPKGGTSSQEQPKLHLSRLRTTRSTQRLRRSNAKASSSLPSPMQREGHGGCHALSPKEGQWAAGKKIWSNRLGHTSGAWPCYLEMLRGASPFANSYSHICCPVAAWTPR
jgi:hypothetical protein